MKKLIFSVSILFATTATAQLKITESPKDTLIWQSSKMSSVPKLIRFNIDSTYSYTLYYKNEKYSSITDIDYVTTGDGATTKQFFELLLEIVEKNTEYNIDLDGKSWYIKKTGSAVMVFSHYTYFYLDQKQIETILTKFK